MRFNSRSYHALLLPHSSGSIPGEVILRHLDHAGSYACMIIDSESVQSHFAYSGKGAISLTLEPRGVAVNLVRSVLDWLRLDTIAR